MTRKLSCSYEAFWSYQSRAWFRCGSPINRLIFMQCMIIFMIKRLAVTSFFMQLWHFVFLVVLSLYAIGVDLLQQVLTFLSIAGFSVKTTQRRLARCCPMPTTPNSGKRHFAARAKNQNSEWTSLQCQSCSSGPAGSPYQPLQLNFHLPVIP